MRWGTENGNANPKSEEPAKRGTEKAERVGLEAQNRRSQCIPTPQDKEPVPRAPPSGPIGTRNLSPRPARAPPTSQDKETPPKFLTIL